MLFLLDNLVRVLFKPYSLYVVLIGQLDPSIVPTIFILCCFDRTTLFKYCTNQIHFVLF